MKSISQGYKEQIKTLGKELDAKITYTINNEEIELGAEDINNISFSYEGSILKSVMKQLNIEVNQQIPIGTIINYQFGLKVNGSYEYLDYGNFIVKEEQIQEDTRSYTYTCYDKMLYAMKDYNGITATFPMTLRTYIGHICSSLDLTFKNANETFANYNKQLDVDYFVDANGTFLGYTFRDVLDQLAEVTASTICINEDDELEIRYVNDTEGKNKIKLPLVQQTANGVSAKWEGNTISVNGTNTKTDNAWGFMSTANFTHPDFQPGETYTVSSTEHTPGTGYTIYVQMNYYRKNTNNVQNGLFTLQLKEDVEKITFTVPEDYDRPAPIFLGVRKECRDVDITFDIMLEEGNQKTEYEPYGDTIDEEYLKDVNVKFGEKYGPINSIVLSRSAGADNIYLKDDASIEQNGLCEIKIEDNQIMSGNNRDEFLPDILNTLDGLEYYLNDFSSTGITYYDLCDRYNIKVFDNIYSCIMFNDEINVNQGLQENVYTERMKDSESDYSKADKTDRKINQAYAMIDKQNGVITNFVSQTTQTQELNNQRILDLTQRTNSVEQRITSTEASIEVIEQQVVAGQQSLRNNLVLIDINGISVSTNVSAISTLMTNEKFEIKMSGGGTLAYFGYDSSTNSTKAEMANLTVDNYLIAGYHRVEKIKINGENRTGYFYVGGGN